MKSGLPAEAEKTQRRLTSHDRTAPGADASVDADDHGAPVLSVSARMVPGNPARAEHMPHAAATDDIFLTPRVIDQSVFNDLAASLRAIIDDARAATAALRQTMQQADRIQQQAASASAQLQERLGLGARMLKAWQIQMDQMQTAPGDGGGSADPTASLARRIEELTSQFQARVQAELDSAQARLDPMASEALAAFDMALAARAQEAGGIERTVSEAGMRAEALVKVVESAEVNVAALSSKSSQSVTKAQADMLRAKGLIGQAQLARRQLGQSLAESTQRLDEAADRADHLGQLAQDVRSRVDQQMQALAMLMHEVATRMDEALARAGGVEERTDVSSAAPTAELPIIETVRPPGSSPTIATPLGSRRG